MAKPKTVDIQLGDQRAQVLESAVPAWERNGWTLVDDGGSESGTEPVVEEQPVLEPEPQDDENEGGDQ